MNCQDFRDRLLEAAPDDRTALDDAAMQEHVRTCGPCRDELHRLEGLWVRLASLPAAREPEFDGWTAVERQLRERPPGSAWTRRAVEWAPRLAAAVLLMVGGAGLDRGWVREVPPDVGVAGGSPVAPARLAHVDPARSGWEEARTSLWKLALENSGTRPARTVDGLVEGLASLAEARVSLEVALATDPDDLRVLTMLEKTRRRELELLRRLAFPRAATPEPPISGSSVS